MDLDYLFKFKHFSCWKFSHMHKYAKNNLFKCLNVFKNIWKNILDACARYFWTFSPGSWYEPGLKARLHAGGWKANHPL
jgi:hypothetical protein